MTQIIVEGVIAPWLWNGRSFYQGSLIDPGLFAPSGTSLTGMPIQVVWNDQPYITAAITIDGTTITLGGPAYDCITAAPYCYPYTVFRSDYQNITVANFNPSNNLPSNIAINNDDPNYAAKYDPHGIGGSFELIGPNAGCNDYHGGLVDPSCQVGLDGYFYVLSQGGNALVSVPGPIVGELSPLFTLALVAALMLRKSSCLRR